ncbi:hypothetical protein Poli38472_002491 [Pythium oligandrum]|uniref:MMS19 nucleotide excision repair protein n=1 Tax=Pythium oligandrum TaxID=41045 RepID=A0A8K1CHX8_PYTOL|nr:hypothetical protein Poli38472_002491 [Pythium oligandrum]|eukprot:TMW63550.1 hypothetical protein Poli38472_002491 [Pythium oligandrum]
MFSLDAPLQPAIDAFVNPENDDTVHKTSLNTVVMQVHRKVAIETLIQSLGLHLTNTDDKVRTRATLLLAEVLTRLPELALSPSAVQLLLGFFTDRLADFPSASACLQALLALLLNHSKKIPSPLTTVELIQKLVKALHVPQLGQAMRKQCYSLMQLALGEPSVVRLLVEQDELGLAFAQVFLNSMEGEKDPRNLLLCLQIARELMSTLASVFEKHDTAILQQYFDVVSCYFPITFTPPPNDPYGITSEDLITSLRKAFAASDLLARHVLPFLLEKLSSTVTEAKLDSIQTLVFCCEAYSINVTLLYLHTIATALYHEVVKGEKKEVIEASLKAITRFASLIGLAKTKSVGGAAYAWTKFVLELTKRATDDLRGNAVDSLASASAGQALAAIGKESAPAFTHVLEASIPLLLEQFKDSIGSPSKTEAGLGRLLLLVNTIDQEIDQSASSQPMRPHATAVIDPLVEFLQNNDNNTPANAKSKKLAIEALSHLITYPPSPLVEPAQVQTLLELFTQFLLFDRSKEVRDECLTSLKAISTIRQKTTVKQYAALVNDTCLAKLMQVVNLGPQDAVVQPILVSSSRAHEVFFEDVLLAITELCRQVSIFRTTVVQLVDLCVEPMATRFYTDKQHHVCGIMGAVAKSVELNADEKESMEFCVATDSSVTPSQQPLVFRLLTAVANTATTVASGGLVDHAVLSACTRVFRTVMQNVLPETQQTIANEFITSFLQVQSSAIASQPAALQLVPLFAAVINSANRSVVLPEVTTVITQLLELAQGAPMGTSTPSAVDDIRREAALSAAKSLASIINKTTEGPDFDALVDLLLEQKLSRVIVDDNQQLSTRIVALQIYVWIAKALVIRGHKQHAPVCLRFLCQFLTARAGSVTPELQMEVAKNFQLLVTEYPDVLNRKCGASITFLFRQRTFDLVFPTLLEFIRGNAPSETTAALVAFSHVIASSPRAMYMPHLGSIFPLMVQAINTDDRALGSSAISTFRTLLFESLEVVKPFLKDVFPGLLKQAQQGTGALDRRDALECLSKLSTIPYELIHPYKDTVLKQLLVCLNDRKRFVRHVAVRVRNQWSVL